MLQGARLDAHFGGAEGNVAVALARLGRPSAMVSALPDDAIGDAAIDSLRKAGVDTSRVVRAPGRMGLYFLTPAGRRQRRLGDLRPRRQRVRRGARLRLAGAARGRGLAASLGHRPRARPGAGRGRPRRDRRGARGGGAGLVRRQFPRLAVGALVRRPGPVLADYIDGADLLFGSHRDLVAGARPRVRRDGRRAAARRRAARRSSASRGSPRSPRPTARSSPPTTTACRRGSTRATRPSPRPRSRCRASSTASAPATPSPPACSPASTRGSKRAATDRPRAGRAQARHCRRPQHRHAARSRGLRQRARRRAAIIPLDRAGFLSDC